MENPDELARRARVARFATVPIVLVGTIAVTAGLTGPVANAAPRHDAERDTHRRPAPDRAGTDITAGPVSRAALTVSASNAQATGRTVSTVSAIITVPSTYVVQQGDTVSAIAERFGLAANDVLARNGLRWNTIIHPGQQLQLRSAQTPTAQPAPPTISYRVVPGDTVTAIARRAGVSNAAVIAANALPADGRIVAGQTLIIPAAPTTAPAAPAPAAATTTSNAPAPAPAREPAIAGSVTIAPGQTAASIASANGVSVSALLAANGLTYTSTIYAGAKLVIPVDRYALTAEQRANAAIIVSVGRQLGVPPQGIVVALAAAMQESGLRNLAGGDRDSVGLFQQRPSQGWGTPVQLQNQRYAATLFFGGPNNPNAGTTRGLLDVPGWQSMTVTQAAQAVQVSAYPNAYGQWQQAATHWLASL
ncbi:LysM peptidoglycan-binding domain-containing protein [Curtobacterium ammoniigenes]|uniref:LysM peptidoglycan-binding domain-containing protein n=1 Tax=Curtobacterium ammoniigenes TaxID=395387 RepID=UPI00082D70D9|nr:LysM peptidoglycan-binding domain-containing protein [Curtobacterium ammoniigenes]